MTILPWRRRRQLAEQANWTSSTASCPTGGRWDFVEGPPYPVPLLPSWERSPLGASTSSAWFMAREIGHNVELSRTAVLLRRYGRGARVAKWGDRYVVVYTLVNSTGYRFTSTGQSLPAHVAGRGRAGGDRALVRRVGVRLQRPCGVGPGPGQVAVLLRGRSRRPVLVLLDA